MSRLSIAFDKLFAEEEKKSQVVQDQAFVRKAESESTMEYGMVPRDFAEAVRACREGRMSHADQTILQTRYGTEGFFFTAVEDIYVINEWPFTRKDKTAFREIFRIRKPIRA